jgi:hypothetical protein
MEYDPPNGSHQDPASLALPQRTQGQGPRGSRHSILKIKKIQKKSKKSKSLEIFYAIPKMSHLNLNLIFSYDNELTKALTQLSTALNSSQQLSTALTAARGRLPGGRGNGEDFQVYTDTDAPVT